MGFHSLPTQQQSANGAPTRHIKQIDKVSRWSVTLFFNMAVSGIGENSLHVLDAQIGVQFSSNDGTAIF